MDCIIEIPAFTSVKYEIDKKYNFVRVDRVLKTSMVYPGNYGYFPNTLSGDGDPLDIIMPVSYPLHPLSIMKVKIVGVIFMEDEAGEDEKIIVYPDDSVDSNYKNINDIKDVSKETLEKIIHFFKHYKDLSRGKFVKIKKVYGKKTAMKVFKDASNRYLNQDKRNLTKRIIRE